jgi:hypothetical protein
MPSSRYSQENPPPELLEEIRGRLAGICADWPPELFDAVTARAAWIEFKYDRAMTDSFASARLRDIRASRDEGSWHAPL